jgi:hypothetical protein
MKRSQFMIMVIAIVTAGLLAACGSEGEGGGLSEERLPTVPPPTRISPEELAKQSAASAGYSLSALAVEDPAQPKSGFSVPADTRLVAVQVELANVSADDRMPIDISNAIVTDDNDVTYSAVSGARDGEIATGEVGKGEKATGWIVFTVPRDVNLKSITYRIGLISTIALEAELPSQ